MINLVKLNENATNHLASYDSLPAPVYKSNLVWKPIKINQVQLKSIENSRTDINQSK